MTSLRQPFADAAASPPRNAVPSWRHAAAWTGTSAAARWAFAAILAVAAALRLYAAVQPGFYHPDAIYQYLEPAHRLAFGDGAITWEWREGIRGWLLPMLLAPLLRVGNAIDPAGPWTMLLPRLATATASLGIVWAAWRLGRQQSLGTAVLAACITATWFELAYFGAQTLSEPLAAAALIVAAVPLMEQRATPRGVALAGGLIAFGLLMRPHYAPAAAALVVAARWRKPVDRRLLVAFVAGSIPVAVASGLADAAAGAPPFAWIVRNIHENILNGTAARYGVSPPLTYVAWWMALWQWWLVPVAIGTRYGAHRYPALAVAAAVTVVVHSLIGHKEYRFIFFATTCIIVLSAVGWGEIVARLDARRRTAAAIAVGLAWALASATLAQAPLASGTMRYGDAGTLLYDDVRADAGTCGVALVYGATYADVPGTTGLRVGTPVSQFLLGDPALPHGSLWQGATRWRATFNRLIAPPGRGRTIPVPGFTLRRCETTADGDPICLYARPGGCTAAPHAPFALNTGLRRGGL